MFSNRKQKALIDGLVADLAAEKSARLLALSGVAEAERVGEEAVIQVQAQLNHVLSMHSEETLIATVQLDPQEISNTLKQVNPTIRVDWVGWKLYIYSKGEVSPPTMGALEIRLKELVSMSRT